MSKMKAPFVRTEARFGRMIFDMILAATVLGIYSSVTYGLRPLMILVVCVLTAMVCEAVCCIIGRRPLRMVLDGTAAITGLTVGLLMSPMVAMWVPMVGTAFAIVVAKAPFGGTGRNVFNPAAAGVALLTVCAPTSMFTYPAVHGETTLPLAFTLNPAAIATEASLASQIQAGANPSIAPVDILLGNFVGAIGTTAFLILLMVVGYLMVRRTVSPWVVLPYFVTCVLVAWISPLSGMNPLNSLLLQLGSGYVLFAGVFLINDPVTAPRFWLGRLVYGVLTAGLVMALQREGRFEAGSCFAILLMNAFSPIIDRWSWHLWHRLTRNRSAREEVDDV
ncbi:MAG: RnfABCDGE type electron transport complex subunit D [Clostridia bacterium]|nr:RnfABCDGE type electron transport complex subunit D [Clostridia bacterium]